MSPAMMTKKPADALSSSKELVRVFEGIVHQVNSNDSITIREEVSNGYPKTKTIVLNSIIAPKFGRHAAKNDTASKNTDDEPFSWETREFLRKKLIGKKVFFKTAGRVCGVGKTTRYYGDIFYPTLDDNIVNELVENGLATVQTVKSNNPTPDVQTLFDLQNKAKAAMVGRWDPNAKNTAKKNSSIDDVESNASVDYIQPKFDKPEEKICATVTIDEMNLGEELVKEGLATVMNNPRDDQMSQCFFILKKAEEIAKQSHKGLYSKLKAIRPKLHVTDCPIF